MFTDSNAYRWLGGTLEPIPVATAAPDELIGVDRQRDAAWRNIDSLVSGGPALNMLLWGEKGCGKSTLVKWLLHEFAGRGLRVIEFSQKDIAGIYPLYRHIREHGDLAFIVYFDDISFDEDDAFYRRFKSVIEGGLEDKPSNLIFVATSNRRHLITERAADTRERDLYSRDDANEKASLFARFGLAIGFYPLTRDQYLDIAEHYLARFEIETWDEWWREAENFAVDRGGRSGRIARQFAVHRLIMGAAG